MWVAIQGWVVTRKKEQTVSFQNCKVHQDIFHFPFINLHKAIKKTAGLN